MSFAYPGTERLVLEDVNLRSRAGSVVAIVGENGAGKTTLVKLLCALYRPASGRILIDGVDLARMPPDGWRSRLSGAFQDFFKFEFRVRHSVGIGDVPRMDDLAAVAAAVDRAGAGGVVEHLTSGLDTQLGPTWPAGVEISFGQWQKLALARGFMRDNPLLLVLDEPTAALDAETEHALFERYAAGGARTWGRQAASRSWYRTASALCAWPTSSWCSTARTWSSRARMKSCWRKAAAMRSYTAFRPRRTARPTVLLLPVHAVPAGAGDEQDHHHGQVQVCDLAAALPGQMKFMDKSEGHANVDRDDQGGPARCRGRGRPAARTRFRQRSPA